MVVKIIKSGNSQIKKIEVVPRVARKIVVQKKKREPTILQAKVIKIAKEKLVANGSNNKGGRISKASIIREAGGSEAVARVPGKVFDSPVVQEALNPVIEKMRNIRTKVLDALDTKEFTKESAFNLTMIAGMLTKDSELLDGKPTERTNHTLTPEKKARLDKMLELNS